MTPKRSKGASVAGARSTGIAGEGWLGELVVITTSSGWLVPVYCAIAAVEPITKAPATVKFLEIFIVFNLPAFAPHLGHALAYLKR
jgi:hypothetical protein